MIITTLIDNYTREKNIKAQHGLSMHIKLDEMNILFDLGSNDLLIENAKKLNIDLTEVDYVVISHGHFDHGGGLEHFLKVNSKSKVLISKKAFNNFYFKIGFLKFNIGLNKELKFNERIILVDSDYKLSDDIRVFHLNNIEENDLPSNKNLHVEKDGKIVKDDFSHELYLIINQDGKRTLFSGCSHKGINNIVNSTLVKCGQLDYIIGGFHIGRKFDGKQVKDVISHINKNSNIKYITCHCTSKNAFDSIKLETNVNRILCGDVLEL